MKVAPSLYQFTAVDDCTCLRVLGLYPDRSAASAKQFLIERVPLEFPFPLQRVQTDKGAEFCSEAFLGALHECKIKFSPNRPRAPHFNGRVQPSQRGSVRGNDSTTRTALTVRWARRLRLSATKKWQPSY